MNVYAGKSPFPYVDVFFGLLCITVTSYTCIQIRFQELLEYKLKKLIRNDDDHSTYPYGTYEGPCCTSKSETSPKPLMSGAQALSYRVGKESQAFTPAKRKRFIMPEVVAGFILGTLLSGLCRYLYLKIRGVLRLRL